jgi:hypothetical protein
VSLKNDSLRKKEKNVPVRNMVDQHIKKIHTHTKKKKKKEKKEKKKDIILNK